MDYFSGGQPNLFTKLKIIVSSFFNFLLCSSTFRFPIQKHNQIQPLLLPFSISGGLKSLISSKQQFTEDPVIRSLGLAVIRSNLLTHSSSSSAFSSSSSSSSSFCFSSIRSCNFSMDDLIGTESGVCLTSNSEEMETRSDFDCRYYRTNRTNRHNFTLQNQRCVLKKQFPPPIPYLATQAAGNRPRSPWILTRYYSNKRLVLKLERVTQHQSLESRRENGRLILNLVPIDDRDQDNLQHLIEEKEENEIVESIECDGGEDECTDSEISLKSYTYGGEGGGGSGGMTFCGVNGNFDERHVVHGHFGSAPLRPMGTVM